MRRIGDAMNCHGGSYGICGVDSENNVDTIFQGLFELSIIPFSDQKSDSHVDGLLEDNLVMSLIRKAFVFSCVEYQEGVDTALWMVDAVHGFFVPVIVVEN